MSGRQDFRRGMDEAMDLVRADGGVLTPRVRKTLVNLREMARRRLEASPPSPRLQREAERISRLAGL